MKAKNQYLYTIILKNGGYHLKSKKEKGKLLDEYCGVTGQNRKAVIRKIRSGKYISSMKKETKAEKRIRKSYYDRNVQYVLIKLWNIFDRPCGQRMVYQIEKELSRLIRFGEIRCSSEMEAKVLQISSAQIDRILSDHKEKEHTKHKRGKKIHPLVYQKIPVQVGFAQDRKTFGNIQIDLVEHCGRHAKGEYIYTLSTTDLASSWWAGGAVLTKGMRAIVGMLGALERNYPFSWKGLHSDNDSAFVNGHLYRYSVERGIELSRSRPYQKNDNYLVEQKNGRVIRRSVGYLRYDTKKELKILNELYHMVSMYHNFFQPVMKLKEKKRVGSKIYRRFEDPKTPFERVVESRSVPREVKQYLKSQYTSLNPAELKRQITIKQDELYRVYRAKRKKKMETLKKVESLKKTKAVSVTFLHDVTEMISVT